MKIINNNDDKRSKLLLIAGIIVFMTILGFIDYNTSFEISLSIFYLIPIAIGSWFLSRRISILLSILCSVVYGILDFLSGNVYSHPLILTWNDFAIFGIYLIVAITLSKLKEVLIIEKELSRTDPLTGLSNVRHFMEVVNSEIERCRRYKHPITLIYFDCDNFKKVNDSFGHVQGNKLLITVASTIRDSIRDTDIPARLGGDEFGILLPETGMEFSKKHISRIHKKLKEDMKKNGWPVTFSIGVATFVKTPESMDELLTCADNLMYSVKRKGKNNINYKVC